MISTRNNLEITFKEALHDIFEQLHDRIGPQFFFIDSIRIAITEISNEEYPGFKLERFDTLLSALVRIVENEFHRIVNSFNDWFRDFMAKTKYETRLLTPVYYHGNDEVCSQLYWSDPIEFHRYPHMILDQFYQCIRDHLSDNLVSALESKDVTGLVENCKDTRLAYFEEIKKVNEVKVAVEAFALKVQNEMLEIRRK